MTTRPLDEFFMREALVVANEGLSLGEIPIGAVVTLDGELITRGYCQDRTKGLLAHAELIALGAIDRKKFSIADRKRMCIYSTLEPCVMCMGAVMSSFLGRLVYAVGAPVDGAVSMVKAHNWSNDSYKNYGPPEIIAGTLKNEALSLFQNFLDTKQNGPYAEFSAGIIRAAQN